MGDQIIQQYKTISRSKRNKYDTLDTLLSKSEIIFNELIMGSTKY